MATSGTGLDEPVRGSEVPDGREPDPGGTGVGDASIGRDEVRGTVSGGPPVVVVSGIDVVVVSATEVVVVLVDVDDVGVTTVHGAAGEAPHPWSW